MEFLRVETISGFSETNPFLLSWLRGGREIEILFSKSSGERTSIYCGRSSEDLLIRAGWKFSGERDFNEKGKKIFIRGDSRFLKFGKENYADRIVELLNEEESGFLRLSIRPHYFQTRDNHKPGAQESSVDRKSGERKGWKITMTYRNDNLGNYLCHIFSSPKVQSRKGKIGLFSPVVAWWEIHQFIPTVVQTHDNGDVRVGSTLNRGDVYLDSRKNPHTMITGSSGSGKSSMIIGMMNHILENRLGKVILIDPHGDTARKMDETGFRRYVISPDSENSINIISMGGKSGIPYKVAEDFVSVLRSTREVQYIDPLVGPRMEDLISRGISLLANIKGMTLVDFYNILRDVKTRVEIVSTVENYDLKKFLEELSGMSREEKASTERAIGRLVNDPMIRSLICNPDDDGELSNAIMDNDLIIFNMERSCFGYEDSKLLSNIFALYTWFTISSMRNGNYFLFLEEGQDYQSTLMADMLSSGRKFGVKVFFVTTSIRAISGSLDSLLFSNVSNYIFMKLTDPDKIRAKEFTGIDIEYPKDSFDFVLMNSSGQERGRVEPVLFSNTVKEFKMRNFVFQTEKKKRDLSSRIDGMILEIKSYESMYIILDEFCQVLGEYDRSEVISLLKEKIARDQDVHYVGRITVNSGNFKGRHECFQVKGKKGQNCNEPSQFKITSDLISNLLEKK